MSIPKEKRVTDKFVISYITLRKAVGLIGIALPIVLFFGFLIFKRECQLPPSISHYYYTIFSTYFTGTLCAVALFLFCYKGPDLLDERAARFAATCALGVAFLPTNPYKDTCDCITVNVSTSIIRNAMHYGSAALLFLTLAYFCLVLFVKTSETATLTPEKQIRNSLYKICGWIIVVCIVSILIITILEYQQGAVLSKLNISTFILEAVGLFAFGFSWLVKGETIFRDKVSNNLDIKKNESH